MHGRIKGTNTGPLMGSPATGKRADFGYMDMYRIANGQIVEVWHVEDIAGMLAQLGLTSVSARGSSESRYRCYSSVRIEHEQVRSSAALLTVAAHGHPIGQHVPLTVPDRAATLETHARHEALRRAQMRVELAQPLDATESVFEANVRPS